MSNIIITPYEYMQRERAKNNMFPLPPDYMDLTKDGQKQARLAVVCNHTTPMDFVAAWELFRKLYLLSTPPGFFYHNYFPSPSFHYEMVHDCALYTRNLIAAPRGTAKSTLIGVELPLFVMLTRPYYRVAVALATDKMVEDRSILSVNS